MVTVNSGEFPLLRNIDATRQPNRAHVYNEWIKAFSDRVPWALESLANVVEDVMTYKVWEEYRLPGPAEYLERIGITGLNLEDPAKLIKALRGKDGNQIRRKLQARMERVTESKRLVEDEGMSLRQAGEALGVSHPTVMADLRVVSESVRTEKLTTPRQWLRVQINSGTKPETAAEKIHSTFGPDFAQALKAAL
jgi:DNA-directed RNA polymerase specialized sigma24 family protein